MAQNPLAISDVDNEVLREADEYLRKHKILELFEVSQSLYHPTEWVAGEVSVEPKSKLTNTDYHLFLTGSHHHPCLQAAREHGDLPDRCAQAEEN